MSIGANDQATILQFAAFRYHGWEHAALFPRLPHALIGNLFQPPRNYVFPLVQDLSALF